MLRIIATYLLRAYAGASNPILFVLVPVNQNSVEGEYDDEVS